jgi:GT2 family glycosyltransferase
MPSMNADQVDAAPRDETCLAVIVHFGDAQPTTQLANQLTQWAVVVVAANDATARPADLDPRVEWFQTSGNVGYAGGFVEAIGDRQAATFALMNNDLEITHEAWRRLRQAMLDPTIWVAGPRIVWPDGSLQSGLGMVMGRTGRLRVDGAPDSGLRDCDWVTGALMMLNNMAVRHVGFDTDYFLGSEDVDLCLRVRRSGGRVVCVGDAPVTHNRSRVIGGMWPYYTVRNRVWMARKLRGRLAAFMTWVYFLGMWGRVFVADVVKRHSLRSSRLHLRALRDSAPSVVGVLRARDDEPRAAQ